MEVAARRITAARVRSGEPSSSSSTARSDRCSTLVLLWTFAVGVAVGLYMFAGYLWASVAAAVLLAAMCWFTCQYLDAVPEEQPPLLLFAPPPALRVAAVTYAGWRAQQQQQVANSNGGGGLGKVDVVEAIPAFEYRKESSGGGAAAEQCAVCISVVRQGETVRRLPPCGHAFHAPCIDGWLRAHATCPMCRADVKVPAAASADGGGAPV